MSGKNIRPVGLAAVVRRPDELYGEVGCAYVVPKSGKELSTAELRAWCKEHIADYKVPKILPLPSRCHYCLIIRSIKSRCRSKFEHSDKRRILVVREECGAMSVVIKNGTVLTADMTYAADVRLDAAKIEAVGPNLTADKELDATGCYVMPGGIDPHTHLEMPFMGAFTVDDFES